MATLGGDCSQGSCGHPGPGASQVTHKGTTGTRGDWGELEGTRGTRGREGSALRPTVTMVVLSKNVI